jgi:hypothetical protein
MIKTVSEHWVCATLARHNWAPALTRDGIARTDILAVGTHLADRPTVEIQVKTASDEGSRPTWLLGGVTQAHRRLGTRVVRPRTSAEVAVGTQSLRRPP